MRPEPDQQAGSSPALAHSRNYWGEHPIAGTLFTDDAVFMITRDHFQIEKSAGSLVISPITSPLQSRTINEPSREEIARKAYFLYLDHGGPEGQDQQHWIEAETLMRAECNASRKSLPLHN